MAVGLPFHLSEWGGNGAAFEMLEIPNRPPLASMARPAASRGGGAGCSRTASVVNGRSTQIGEMAGD